LAYAKLAEKLWVGIDKFIFIAGKETFFILTAVNFHIEVLCRRVVLCCGRIPKFLRAMLPPS